MQGSLQRAEFLIVYSFHAKADADAKAALCNTGDHPNHRFFVRAAGEDMKKAAREVAQ
jgi:hypothetical protein